MRASTWGVILAMTGVLGTGSAWGQGEPAAFRRLMEAARPVGMGSAFTALADDVNTIYYNPAGLSMIPHKEVSGTHLELDFDRNANFFAFAFPNHPGDSAWGVSYNRLNTNGIPETRVDGTGAPIVDVNGNVVIFSIFDTVEEATTVSYGWKHTDQIRFGVTGRLLHQQIFNDSSTGVGLDLGALYQPTEDVRIGFAVRDLFETVKFNVGGSQPIPFRINTGAAVRGWSNVVYTGEVEYTESGDTVVRAGAEKWWQKHYALRAGIDDGDVSVGASAKYQKLQFDWAFRENELDDNHRLTATFRF